MRLPVAISALSLFLVGSSTAQAQHVIVPHTTTHTHLVPHNGHFHAVPHTTTHFHVIP
jgi:hypothetical protein